MGAPAASSVAMATAAKPPLPRPPGTDRPWVGPLLVGLAFGLAYGITDRLLRLNIGGWVPLGQTFDVRPASGTSLESLRQRSGDLDGSVRGDLAAQAEEEALEQQEALERERLKQQQAGLDPSLGDAALDASGAGVLPAPELNAADGAKVPAQPPAAPLPAAMPRPSRGPAPLPTP